MIPTVQILQGDCVEQLRTLPAESVHCCVTSPPYWGLRDYGVAGQIGLERTPQEYVAKMVEVFREVKRVLRDDGILFLNLGDSYCGGGNYRGVNEDTLSEKQSSNRGANGQLAIGRNTAPPGLKIFPQSYRLRKDLTDDEKERVVLDMFGVRLDENQTKGQGTLPEVLPGGVQGETMRSRPDVASEGISGELCSESSESNCINAREAPEAQVGRNRETGREVRVLRGIGAGVSDSGSHQWGRCCTQEWADWKEQGEQRQNLQGHQESEIPSGQISSALLQLQLCDRLLGILSTHTFKANEIPDSARFAFAPVVIFKPKDLCGIPWRVAFALQEDGWYLRSDIIWHKPNPMPESVTDRPTKSHEYLFLLAKAERYHYNAEAIKEEALMTGGGLTHNGAKHNQNGQGANNSNFGKYMPTTRNRRSVWSVPTSPYSEAHFATFPPDLIKPCILAGCPVGGTVIDPFGGSGTTGQVALELGRNAVLIELNPKYVELIRQRCDVTPGLKLS